MSQTALKLAAVVTIAFCLTGAVGPLTAQDAGMTDSAMAIPEPQPEDVESIDAILTAVYDVISGPASEERDWNRFLSLFAEDARLIPTAVTPEGEVTHRTMTPHVYSQRAAMFFKQPGGFYEREIARKVDRFGNIAQVFSTYASFREGEEDPFMRGINSIQLIDLGDRWAIVSIFWDAERDDNPIPDEYLKMSESGSE